LAAVTTAAVNAKNSDYYITEINVGCKYISEKIRAVKSQNN